jgi:hypothetical protein
MNIYTQRFRASCPVNNRSVDYVLRIESAAVIRVEDLQSVVGEFKSGFHEDFADQLFAKFGGMQTMCAHHHGTDIKTVRP